jgi:hypothetical protein
MWAVNAPIPQVVVTENAASSANGLHVPDIALSKTGPPESPQKCMAAVNWLGSPPPSGHHRVKSAGLEQRRAIPPNQFFAWSFQIIWIVWPNKQFRLGPAGLKVTLRTLASSCWGQHGTKICFMPRGGGIFLQIAGDPFVGVPRLNRLLTILCTYGMFSPV